MDGCERYRGGTLKINWKTFGRVVLAIASVGCSELAIGMIGRGRRAQHAGQVGGAIVDQLQGALEGKKCPSCGAKSPANAAFCGQCGAKF